MIKPEKGAIKRFSVRIFDIKLLCNFDITWNNGKGIKKPEKKKMKEN